MTEFANRFADLAALLALDGKSNEITARPKLLAMPTLRAKGYC